MLGWFESRKSLRVENEALRSELRQIADALEHTIQREGELTAMLEARDRDNEKLRAELQHMTNVALARSLRTPQEQPRDVRGRFRSAA